MNEISLECTGCEFAVRVSNDETPSDVIHTHGRGTGHIISVLLD